MEKFLQKPFTDANRSVCIEQALIRAYEAKDREAIKQAALEAQKYVDEGGDFDDWQFDDSIEDYNGNDAKMLTEKYLVRLLHDRTMDGGDVDQDYIRTGWHIELDANYRNFKHFKEKYPDAVLLFRDEAAYCAYEEDADKAAKTCDIPLLNWNGVKAAGFPHHALDVMLPKFIRAGYRVAICDQLEAPKPKKRITETVKRKEPIQLELFSF